MLTPSNFECNRCADCCKYCTVKLDEQDINKIKKSGYDEEFFMGYDAYINSPVMKVNDKGCVFLIKKGDKYFCKIYQIRPKVCKQYPFVNSNEVEGCKPALLKNKFKR